MRHTYTKKKLSTAVLLITAGAAISWQCPTYAQDTDQSQPSVDVPKPQVQLQEIEEIVTIGRYLDSSQKLVAERMEDAFSTDLLGADMIGRLGDSTVASALRRVPGLTLVEDKFVYIRGLGERYSQTTLNGAQIPSPDLTRSIIPLDIFPTSVVESLRVQKSWSPDLSANFAGGGVDIRTKGIPDNFQFGFEVSSGFNSETNGKALTYPGGGNDNWGTDDGTRELSSNIQSQLTRFHGDISTQSILDEIRKSDSSATTADAAAVNRQVALDLYRDFRFEEKNVDPDYGIKANIGNNFIINEDWTAGVLVSTAYSNSWKNSNQISRDFTAPSEQYEDKEESTHSVNLTGTLNFGVTFTNDHQIDVTSLYLRNTDDESAITDMYNANRQRSSGLGFRNYDMRFEERELQTNQIKGTHYFGDATRSMLPILDKVLGFLPLDSNLSWFYSDSTSETSRPSEVRLNLRTLVDVPTGKVLSETINPSSSAANYKFTDLEDNVENYGWQVNIPLEFGDSTLELAGGYNYNRKTREYKQLEFNLGTASPQSTSILALPLDEFFSEPVVTNPINGFQLSTFGNNQSFIAATMTDAVFGSVDWTYNDTWRVVAGARWEDYRQVGLDWNPLGYTVNNPQISIDPNNPDKGIFTSDEIYPAIALTYMTEWWAETFQLRFGWSETAIRPDLREINDGSYRDPITGDLTEGCPTCVPSDVTNYDIRAEWYFSSGDSLTVTLFQKDILEPIDRTETAAAETRKFEIVNGESAEVYGVELEWLKELGFMGDVFDPFFLQGNLTLQDSELRTGTPGERNRADNPTNRVRELTNASDYVLNLVLGFDSEDGQHTASLAYNVFGERLYIAGRAGRPDGYEQPFHSLDLNYFWYPTDSITFNLKAQNILGDTIEIERDGVVELEQDPGTAFSASLSWAW